MLLLTVRSIDRGIKVEYQTSGTIPASYFHIWSANPELITINIKIPSISEERREIFEPLTTDITRRLTNFKLAKDLGIKRHVTIGPLFPDIDDNQERLERLFEMLIHYKVDQATFDFVKLSDKQLTWINERSWLAERINPYLDGNTVKQDYFLEKQNLMERIAEAYEIKLV
jgi:DNA repair photolyase